MSDAGFEIVVANTGDPIKVAALPFFEANKALRFDRGAAFGMRLNVRRPPPASSPATRRR
jgi:urease subunit gamma/beta